MEDIYDYLSGHGIEYQRVDHRAVFTCEQSEKYVPPLPGKHTKNLFLRDKKGRRHFLVAVGYEKSVDLKKLAKLLGVDRLSMGSEKRLSKYLGVTPGAVTLLGLVNDTDAGVEVIIDELVWQADAIKCHPLVNTATLAIAHHDIEHFLKVTGHTAQVVDVPARADV